MRTFSEIYGLRIQKVVLSTLYAKMEILCSITGWVMLLGHALEIQTKTKENRYL